MADKSTILRAFNTHFFDFINDIINVTDNEEIKVAKTSFELFKRANPTLIIKVWYSNIYSPYKDVIAKGNISFFFENHLEGAVVLLIVFVNTLVGFWQEYRADKALQFLDG